MGIQPIDLQSMYSQISNVAKNVGGQQQTAQLNDSIQQQAVIQRNLENARKVQQTSGEKSTAKNIDSNGSNSSFYGQNRKKKQDNPADDFPPDNNAGSAGDGNKPHYLGTIIDISR